MIAKPMKTLELHYPMIQVLIIIAGPREAHNPNPNIDQRIVYCACMPGL